MSSLPPYTIVRQSCQSLLQRSLSQPPPVTVDTAAADAFVSSMDVDAIRSFGSSLAQDANCTGGDCDFTSVLQEAAFIVLLHALDFGSGWRKELHAHHGKGAFLTIKPGVEALFRADPQLTARFLENETSRANIAEWFQLVDKRKGCVPDNLLSLVDLVQLVLHEIGSKCRDSGSLVQFVQEMMKKVSNTPTAAGNIVSLLVDTFPVTFDDCYKLSATANETAQPHTVYFYKKAQLVVGEMYHRFRDSDDRFRFRDGDQLTAYVDNVICAALRYKGIVRPNECITTKIETGVELVKGSVEEVYLRASALTAIEYMVRQCQARQREGQSSLSASELGNYLWGGLGKEPDVRKFQRHATKTVFY